MGRRHGGTPTGTLGLSRYPLSCPSIKLLARWQAFTRLSSLPYVTPPLAVHFGTSVFTRECCVDGLRGYNLAAFVEVSSLEVESVGLPTTNAFYSPIS